MIGLGVGIIVFFFILGIVLITVVTTESSQTENMADLQNMIDPSVAAGLVDDKDKSDGFEENATKEEIQPYFDDEYG